MKRRDFILIFLVILVAVLMLFLLRPSQNSVLSGHVMIYQNGTLVAQGQIGQKDSIIISGENGEENVIEFTAQGVKMACSTCKNQECIHQGEVTADNFRTRALQNKIVCLPNKIVVELELTDSQALELPDVVLY